MIVQSHCGGASFRAELKLFIFRNILNITIPGNRQAQQTEKKVQGLLLLF